MGLARAKGQGHEAERLPASLSDLASFGLIVVGLICAVVVRLIWRKRLPSFWHNIALGIFVGGHRGSEQSGGSILVSEVTSGPYLAVAGPEGSVRDRFHIFRRFMGGLPGTHTIPIFP